MKQDLTEKRLESCNDVFADIFNNLVFKGKHLLNEAFLEPLPTESYSRKRDGTLRQGNRDIHKADRRNGRYRLICGEENQTGIDNTMPERVMGYDYASYEEQIKILEAENAAKKAPAYTKRIHDEQKLAPVITAVLYWGEEPWERPLRLHDMLEFPMDMGTELRNLVADYPINVISMANLTEEERRRLTSDFRYVAEYAACRKEPEKLQAFMKKNQQPLLHPEEFMDAMSAIAGKKICCDIEDKMLENKSEGITMYDVVGDFIKVGRLEGKEIGITEGIQRINQLNQSLLRDKRYQDLERAASDAEYQNALLKEYQIP